MPKKLPPVVFNVHDRKFAMNGGPKRAYKATGFSAWHKLLTYEQRNLSDTEMFELAEPLLRARIETYLPNAEFYLEPMSIANSPWRVANGAPPHARHWKIYMPNRDDYSKFCDLQELIWQVPYKEYY